ncbi:SDR family oxidoreductase [Streptomyces sp. NPDC046915]|uniref:SDR family oxidoreductase n=1 Tax=Streptomyces sp. NPDC046915 TaxID=3155257 RepID=UPI0034104634
MLRARGAGHLHAGLTKTLVKYPIGHLGTPEEIARVALFPCSDEASFLTGSIVAAGGGMTAQWESAMTFHPAVPPKAAARPFPAPRQLPAGPLGYEAGAELLTAARRTIHPPMPGKRRSLLRNVRSAPQQMDESRNPCESDPRTCPCPRRWSATTAGLTFRCAVLSDW